MSLPGAFVGFLSCLLALGILFMVYGPNTLFFCLYTWPLFLALMPVAVLGTLPSFALHFTWQTAVKLHCYTALRRADVRRPLYVVNGLAVTNCSGTL